MKKYQMNKLFAFILFVFTSVNGLACAEHEAQSRQSEYEKFLAKVNTPGQDIQLDVPKISCMACASKIKKALKPLQGVEHIEVDVDTKKLRFICQNCDSDAIKAKLQEIGYPAAEKS